MTNPATRSAPRAGFSVSGSSNKAHSVPEPINSAQDHQLPVTISKFWRNRHRQESVCLTLREYQGAPLVDLRIFETGRDGIDRPTSKGIALSIKRLPALADAFAAANREAHRLGLFGSIEASS
jgi:hypothetical protein